MARYYCFSPDNVVIAFSQGSKTRELKPFQINEVDNQNLVIFQNCDSEVHEIHRCFLTQYRKKQFEEGLRNGKLNSRNNSMHCEFLT